MGTKKRAWVKAATWRLIAITVLAVIAYSITGQWKEVTAITLLYHGIQVVVYYLHERVWERISWGLVKHPLAEIPVNRQLSAEDKKSLIEHLKQLGYLD